LLGPPDAALIVTDAAAEQITALTMTNPAILSDDTWKYFIALALA
jgi:hypothetical protein